MPPERHRWAPRAWCHTHLGATTHCCHARTWVATRTPAHPGLPHTWVAPRRHLSLTRHLGATHWHTLGAHTACCHLPGLPLHGAAHAPGLPQAPHTWVPHTHLVPPPPGPAHTLGAHTLSAHTPESTTGPAATLGAAAWVPRTGCCATPVATHAGCRTCLVRPHFAPGRHWVPPRTVPHAPGLAHCDLH
ncbi:hypothetical protein GPJ56_004549 [Histomonas meleagridis]|nr:hypothetical protein GPJ56_004549 [Histomonas meleagridis]